MRAVDESYKDGLLLEPIIIMMSVYTCTSRSVGRESRALLRSNLVTIDMFYRMFQTTDDREHDL